MMTKRSHRKPGRPPMTQTDRVLSALNRGAQDSKTIARLARVPRSHVHPLLNRLRARGQIAGFIGDLRVKPQGLARIAPRGA